MLLWLKMVVLQANEQSAISFLPFSSQCLAQLPPPCASPLSSSSIPYSPLHRFLHLLLLSSAALFVLMFLPQHQSPPGLLCWVLLSLQDLHLLHLEQLKAAPPDDWVGGYH